MPGGPFPFDAVAGRLRARLAAGALPGHAAHLTMAPSHRLDAEVLSVRAKTCREAAVLVLLYPGADGAATVVLTARPPDLRDHAGQVAFPGGAREPGEGFVETALREAREEVGLDPAAVEVVGALTPLYIPPTRFCAHPFAALAEVPPLLVPLEREVAAILHVPLADLFDPAAVALGEWEVRGEPSRVPYVAVGPHPVWGATAMMLAELRALVTA